MTGKQDVFDEALSLMRVWHETLNLDDGLITYMSWGDEPWPADNPTSEQQKNREIQNIAARKYTKSKAKALQVYKTLYQNSEHPVWYLEDYEGYGAIKAPTKKLALKIFSLIHEYESYVLDDVLTVEDIAKASLVKI